MRTGAQFGVGLASTPDFIPFVLASVASIRRFNDTLPVTVYVDRPSPQLQRHASGLRMNVVRIPTAVDTLWAASAAERESTSSRLVKIQSLLRTDNDPHLYLDSDTVLLGDLGELENDLAGRLGTEADLFMLLHRPVAPTFWGDRHFYFRDPGIDRETATRLVNETYGLDLPTSFIDELVCWNSGVIYGTAAALRTLATRWLTLYERMLRATTRDRIIPRDQLGFWIALWELRTALRVSELPRRWNFMAGHLLGIPQGTAQVDEAGFSGVRVLHLAQNKFDPWALRRVRAVLDGLGVPAPRDPSLRPDDRHTTGHAAGHTARSEDV